MKYRFPFIDHNEIARTVPGADLKNIFPTITEALDWHYEETPVEERCFIKDGEQVSEYTAFNASFHLIPEEAEGLQTTYPIELGTRYSEVVLEYFTELTGEQKETFVEKLRESLFPNPDND